jgi:L-asparaginase
MVFLPSADDRLRRLVERMPGSGDVWKILYTELVFLLILQAGGTIDKDYPRTTGGYAFEIGEPAARRVLEAANPAFDCRTVSVVRKDSLELTAEDRRALRDACTSAAERRIVVTHGTDTMIETARALAGVPGKVIVLTGAMRPERFANSDAAFNLGLAVGAAQTLPPGVYVAMHGRVHHWDRVARTADGQFVEAGPVPSAAPTSAESMSTT